MSLSFDDLTTWYQQTIAEREKAARTLPDPQTPVEFAQAQLAALGSSRDAVTLLLEYIVAALTDLDGRVSPPVKTAATSASGKAATSSGSTASAST